MLLFEIIDVGKSAKGIIETKYICSIARNGTGLFDEAIGKSRLFWKYDETLTI